MRAARLALVLYASAILTIGITGDWRTPHEDGGAFSTTLALSHLRLGLARTRAHDFLYNPHTGEMKPLGHHPPGLALMVAGAFFITGSDAPVVARSVAIGFTLGSLLLMTALLGEFVAPSTALLGGFVMATLPMCGYFGRMASYEPPSFFFVLLALWSYVRFKRTMRRSALCWLSLGVALGGLIDWPVFFFCAALAATEALDLLRGRSSTFTLITTLVLSAAATFAFDLWHMWWAARGSMQAFQGVLATNQPPWQQPYTIFEFAWRMVGTFKRWYSFGGAIATVLATIWTLRPDTPLAKRFFAVSDPALCRRLVLAMVGAAAAYVLAAPNWAWIHQFWQYYFLPAVVVGLTLLWQLLNDVPAGRPTLRRALRIAGVLAIVANSAYQLWVYHTIPGEWAVQETARLRATYLAPRSAP